MDHARRELEYVQLDMEVPSDKIGYVIGKEGKNIKDVIAKSGVTAINLTNASGRMLFFGRRTCAEVAISLIQFQLQQLQSMETQAEEMEQLRREMDEIALNWGESYVIERDRSDRYDRSGGFDGGRNHHQHQRGNYGAAVDGLQGNARVDGGGVGRRGGSQQQSQKGRQQQQQQQQRRQHSHRNGNADSLTVTVENELAR